MQALHTLSKNSKFKHVSASEHCEEYIRDSFISGLSSHHIRQRLLENSTLKLTEAYNQDSQRNNEVYSNTEYSNVASINKHPECTTELALVSTKPSRLCYFCGIKRHPRQSCPARDAEVTIAARKDISRKYANHQRTLLRLLLLTTMHQV